MKSHYDVEDCNFISVVDIIVAERLNSYCSNEEIKVITLEELEDEDLQIADIEWLGEKQLMRIDKHFESINILNREVKLSVPSIEWPLIWELKILPSHLKYVYLGDNDTLSAIISSSLNTEQKKSLVDVLEKYKNNIIWTMVDIKRLSPFVYMHKILLEDCYSNSVE